MDNDSAHHANIALHMHLTGDYVSLIDYTGDYLDKPHLHFWLCAFSYKIFGVTTFAYKLPSFLFTIGGIYSVYRLAKKLYDEETGKLAALITASAFAFILANTDVRMDAILTASIAFSSWQLVEFVHHQKIQNALLAALGLALGFSVKGHIGVVLPLIAIFFYILYLRQWKLFFNPKWILMLLSFGLFISPVVYSYYLQYNLHPEIIVRGRNNINGIEFILFGQSIERFQGDNFGATGKKDYLFFIHSFLWAFTPWSLLVYFSMANRLQLFLKRDKEWLTTASFIFMLLIVTFSGFKLPHYLNIIFPFAAIMTAVFILEKKENPKSVKAIFIFEMIVASLLLIMLLLLNAWAFPVQTVGVIVIVVLLLSVVFYFILTASFTNLQKAVAVPVSVMALFFFCMNANFYTQLLKYQEGKELGKITNGKVEPVKVYSWDSTYSASFHFYTKTLHKQFSDSVLQKENKVWLMYDIKKEVAITNKGYKLGEKYSAISYRISRLSLPFLNPATRPDECSQMIIAEISR